MPKSRLEESDLPGGRVWRDPETDKARRRRHAQGRMNGDSRIWFRERATVKPRRAAQRDFPSRCAGKAVRRAAASIILRPLQCLFLRAGALRFKSR